MSDKTPEQFSSPGLFILVSLATGDKHGYAMLEDIENLTGTRLGPGTLYGALTRLEQHGLIEALPAEDRRRPYRLTTKGKTFLQHQLETLHQFTQAGLQRLQTC